MLVGGLRELERFEGGWGERGWLLTSTYLETWIPRIVTVGRMGLGACDGEVNGDSSKQFYSR